MAKKSDSHTLLSRPCSTWRLIPPLEAPGSIQMAIDRWLLHQHQTGNHPPTLRFYTWSPIAISLGYHQRHYPDFWHHLTWQDQAIELVRRPSGGRAVLHQGDLTYAVILSGLSGNRIEAYQTICQFLIEGWRQLGVELHYGEAGRGYIHNPNCFGTATGADLVTTDSTKLIGSAQLRRGQTILQHGSIRLTPDLDLFQQVFGIETNPLVLPAHLQSESLISTVINALMDAASQQFGMHLINQPLTEAEWNDIKQIVNSETELKNLENRIGR